MASRLAALKRRAGVAGVPILYVNDNFGKWRSDFRKTVAHCTSRSSPGRVVSQRLRPSARDYFVLKPKHSGFFGTTLDPLLETLGVRRVILTGIAGNICVLFTANDAYMRDLEIFAPRDCIVSNTAAENDHALRQIENVLKGNVTESTRLQFRPRRAGARRRKGVTTMAAKNHDTTPYWSTSATFPQFAKLAEDVATDVVVVGGGVTGLTAAYLLAKAGKQVVVLERGRCAGTDTGHTSAHLTMVTDTRLGEPREEVRAQSRASGLGRGAGRHREDRRADSRAHDRRRLRVGRRIPARAARRGRERPGGAIARRRPSWRATSISTRSTSRRRHSSTAPVSASPIRPAFTRASTWPGWRRRSWRSAAGSTSTRRPRSSATSRAR